MAKQISKKTKPIVSTNNFDDLSKTEFNPKSKSYIFAYLYDILLILIYTFFYSLLKIFIYPLIESIFYNTYPFSHWSTSITKFWIYFISYFLYYKYINFSKALDTNYIIIRYVNKKYSKGDAIFKAIVIISLHSLIGIILSQYSYFFPDILPSKTTIYERLYEKMTQNSFNENTSLLTVLVKIAPSTFKLPLESLSMKVLYQWDHLASILSYNNKNLFSEFLTSSSQTLMAFSLLIDTFLASFLFHIVYIANERVNEFYSKNNKYVHHLCLFFTGLIYVIADFYLELSDGLNFNTGFAIYKAVFAQDYMLIIVSSTTTLISCILVTNYLNPEKQIIKPKSEDIMLSDLQLTETIDTTSSHEEKKLKKN